MKEFHLTHEQNSEVAGLRRRMDEFYSSFCQYEAFQEPSGNVEEWAYVNESIRLHSRGGRTCRVLEFGAGRTGFAGSLGSLRNSTHLTVQDVTAVNADYLRTQADEVHIGRIGDLDGQFEVIFSTFVLEHISDPKRTLELLLDRLAPGGTLLLFCPRYDVPFYLSHSADHYDLVQRLWIAIAVCWRRLVTMFTGRPAFLIHSDPAILHLDWRRDRDAIHWVSLIDLKVFFRGRGDLKNLAIRSGTFKDWCVKNLLRINIRFTRAAF